MTKRKRAEIEPSPEHVEAARAEAPPPHAAHGLFYEDPRFAALASIARASGPCAPEALALVGATDGETRLPTDAEVRAAAVALGELRETHLALAAARAFVASTRAADEAARADGAGGGRVVPHGERRDG